MSIRVQCGCGQAYIVPDDAAGKAVKCVKCQMLFTIRAASDHFRNLDDPAFSAPQRSFQNGNGLGVAFCLGILLVMGIAGFLVYQVKREARAKADAKAIAKAKAKEMNEAKKQIQLAQDEARILRELLGKIERAPKEKPEEENALVEAIALEKAERERAKKEFDRRVALRLGMLLPHERQQSINALETLIRDGWEKTHPILRDHAARIAPEIVIEMAEKAGAQSPELQRIKRIMGK